MRRQETDVFSRGASEVGFLPKETQLRRRCDKQKHTGGVETKLKDSSLVPSGLCGIVQTENEAKRAISAGVWGPGLSVGLSGCRVRGMDLEC